MFTIQLLRSSTITSFSVLGALTASAYSFFPPLHLGNTVELIIAAALTPTNQNQEGVGLMIATLPTLVEEKLIMAVIDNSVNYALTLNGYHKQYLKSTRILSTFLKQADTDVDKERLGKC